MSDQEQLIAKGRFLRFVSRNGWEYMKRENISGIVIIVPITNQGEVILVEQFRPPLQARVIEWPAGLAGDISGSENEPLTAAAHRELTEETGYKAGQMIYLTEGPPAPGSSGESLTFFLAKDLEKIGPGGGDASEDILVHQVPLNQIDSWLKQKASEGILIDPKTYAGLYFLLKDKTPK